MVVIRLNKGSHLATRCPATQHRRRGAFLAGLMLITQTSFAFGLGGKAVSPATTVTNELTLVTACIVKPPLESS